MGKLDTQASPWTPRKDAGITDAIQRALRGDNTAFRQLFEQYKNLVYRTAYLLLNNRADAEDVLQEVFLRVYRSLDAYDPSKAAFTTWLYRITVNRCRDRWKQGGVATIWIEDVPALELPQDPPAQERIAESESIQRALRQLSPKLKVVLVLRYEAELSYAEIARVLRIPVGTVRSRLYAAHRAIREYLETSM